MCVLYIYRNTHNYDTVVDVGMNLGVGRFVCLWGCVYVGGCCVCVIMSPSIVCGRSSEREGP